MGSTTELDGVPFLPAYRRMARKAAALLRRFWRSEFRRRRVSWSRFREKRLTLRGFLTFDRNARLRTYIYLTILAANLVSWYGPASRPKLVRIACRAIEEASLPSVAFAVWRYERAMQCAALRDALLARYDTNRNGRVGAGEARRLTKETALQPGDLAAVCRRRDLTKLLAAAQARRLLPDRITREVKNAYELPPYLAARRLSRANLQEGLREYRRWRAQLWAEVEPDLTYRYAQPRDYLKWETWRRGGERFYRTGYELLRITKHALTHPGEAYRGVAAAMREYVNWPGPPEPTQKPFHRPQQ